jgi:hypothetical protein
MQAFVSALLGRNKPDYVLDVGLKVSELIPASVCASKLLSPSRMAYYNNYQPDF